MTFQKTIDFTGNQLEKTIFCGFSLIPSKEELIKV